MWAIKRHPRRSGVHAPQERVQRHALLIEAMEGLTDREKQILTERRLVEDPRTLEELSQEFGVSRERVRQIEVRAFEKVQEAVQHAAREKARAREQERA